MARINKAKNFAGKSYVVSNEIESLIQSMSLNGNVLKFGANTIGDDTVALGNGVDFTTWIEAAKDAAKSAAVTTVVGTAEDNAEANTVYGAKADATAKANKALEDAKADAKNKADQALADAKAYADQAEADAVSAAATDAKNKADQALVDAKAYADQAEADAVSAAATDATTKANKALDDAKAYADGIAAAAISVEEGNGIAISTEGTKNVISIVDELIKLEAGENADGTYASVYDLKIIDGESYKTVGSINIPKDQFLKNAEYKDGSINLTFAVEGKGDVVTSIDVADLIDTYTAAANATEIQLKVENNEFSATIVNSAVTTAKIADGAVTEAKLNESVNASLDKADSAIQAGDVAKITYEDSNVKAALDDIYTQIGEGGSVASQIEGAINALDSSVAVEGTAQKEGVMVVTGVTQADGKLTAVAEVEVEKAGSVAAAKAELLGDANSESGSATIAGANKAADAAKSAADDAQADVDTLSAAVTSKAVQMVEDTVTVAQADANTAATFEVEGRLVSVYDAQGVYVFPDTVKYADGKTTCTVNFGQAANETWTVVYTTLVTLA